MINFDQIFFISPCSYFKDQFKYFKGSIHSLAWTFNIFRLYTFQIWITFDTIFLISDRLHLKIRRWPLPKYPDKLNQILPLLTSYSLFWIWAKNQKSIKPFLKQYIKSFLTKSIKPFLTKSIKTFLKKSIKLFFDNIYQINFVKIY